MNAPLPAATLLMLALDSLGTNGPFQQRHTPASPEADAGLVESIRIMGVLQPILVRWDDEVRQHQVVDGHRRVVAARVAGLETIRALRVETDERTSLAAGVAANLQREGLAPVDQWRALVHLQEKGWTLESAAMALGTPLRLARQLDKLGRLHPDLLAAIEEFGLPVERDLGEIALAPLDVQEAAVKKADNWEKVSKTKRRPRWWYMAASCRVGRIPKSRAIFDADASDLVWEEDLFAQPSAKDAITTTNVAGFIEHQLDALRAKALRIKKLHLAEWDPKASGPRLPSGWARTFEKQTVGAERYTAVIPQGPDAGGIIEIYAVPPAPKVSKTAKPDAAASAIAEKAPAGRLGSDVAAAPLPVGDGDARDEHGADEADFDATPAPAPQAKPARGPLTEKGRILVAAAKTTAIRCALRDRRDHTHADLLLVLVLAMCGDNVEVRGDPVSKWTRTSFSDLAARLVNEDGSENLDLNGGDITAIAAEAAARMIVCDPTGAFCNSSGRAAEWIGKVLRADRDMPRLDTPEILATATGDTLRDAARAAGLPVGGSSKALRERLAGHAEGMTLPGSAFDAPGPPRAKAVPEGHVGPFPCAGCSDVDACIRDVVCIRAEGEFNE